MEYYSPLKRKQTVTTWMHLEDILLRSEVSQSQEEKDYMIPLTGGSQRHLQNGAVGRGRQGCCLVGMVSVLQDEKRCGSAWW
jgi:hypothetical protein